MFRKISLLEKKKGNSVCGGRIPARAHVSVLILGFKTHASAVRARAAGERASVQHPGRDCRLGVHPTLRGVAFLLGGAVTPSLSRACVAFCLVACRAATVLGLILRGCSSTQNSARCQGKAPEKLLEAAQPRGRNETPAFPEQDRQTERTQGRCGREVSPSRILRGERGSCAWVLGALWEYIFLA